MVITLSILVVVLAVLCIFLYKRQKDAKALHQKQLKKIKREKITEIEEIQLQTAATLEITEEKLLQEKNRELAKAAEEQVALKQLFEEKLLQKNNYINHLLRYKRDKGEILTHTFLGMVKEEFVERGMLNYDDMFIMGNVFIPHTTNTTMAGFNSRQIDHLVLMRTGIYMIETKYWAGDVLHGISKRTAKEFSFILDKLFGDLKDTDERTIVVKGVSEPDTTSERESTLKITRYGDGNLDQQVKITAGSLHHFLNRENLPCQWVQGILYFGYPQDQNNRLTSFVTNSSERNPPFISSQEELKRYLELQATKEPIYSTSELKAMKELLLSLNVVS
ncbi:nuclease-related domain-containing protein [Fictibacillus fluitans]|uniref:NERD domain-containing protein n=1 Tax=Fictibacillus fluitans TaxID=3058422 RepID=A0ABT8I096_9BACL|nr:NERD domain-containing protein [Fictibacillus sp. NE201]MDN4526458.1 NERD domain-containing protein [Fictibacillus sp. NE201]